MSISYLPGPLEKFFFFKFFSILFCNFADYYYFYAILSDIL